jgi:hypothetical protein
VVKKTILADYKAEDAADKKSVKEWMNISVTADLRLEKLGLWLTNYGPELFDTYAH